MKCNARKQPTENTFVFMIGDNNTGKVCKLHLPMRFKKHFDALKITDVPKFSDEFNLSKPISDNNATALKKFSEIIFEMSTDQIDDFTNICIERYPTTISDLLLIAAEAAGYNSLHASNYFDLAKGFVNYMQMADPEADVCKTEEKDFEELDSLSSIKQGDSSLREYFITIRIFQRS